ncbi:MAG: HTH-type transcriptional activator IlvY [Marinobacterium sp.]|nr:HTH-type transcriptional activator IlvY [Marinobacterium sp.]
MDTRTLQQFLILADTLHFGRASEQCYVSPSALSRSIKQLEEGLGCELFTRDNRSVRLTADGELFQSYARDALDQWDAIRQQLMQRSGILRGEISVYCSVTASYSFLFDILHEFRARHPGIEIKLHTGDPDTAISRVQNGLEEITIAAKPAIKPQGMEFQHIAESPLVFIAPKEPGALAAQLTAPIDWASIPMILSEEGVSRDEVNGWFTRKKLRPTIYAQVAGNEAIVSMVSLGFGVGVVPQIVLENSPLADKVTIMEVRPALKPYNVGLFVLEKKLKSPLIRAFWDQVSQSHPANGPA